MPRKKKVIPDELQKIVNEVKQKQEEEDLKEARELVKKYKEKRSNDLSYWDFKIGDQIQFFDRSLSYELTGYRPIDETHGLDFKPEWFTETREQFHKTGHYCSYLPGSKRYREFWNEQYRRCREGFTVNGYTITGDHYFFLNFYQLPITKSASKAGGGRKTDFPDFYVAQYEFFHYYELAKRLRKHAGLMKARGVGFSEINAAISACTYTVIRESITMVTCYDKGKLDRTLSKDWNALKFLDSNTDGGMFKLRQLSDTALLKKSGHFKNIQGGKVPAGWQSVIQGVVADDPQKIRGDRVDVLIYDEAGSWKDFTKAFIQGEALVNINGDRFGIKVAGGTGGDSGPNLEGLKDLYYNPDTYDVLPYRHNYTQDGSTILSGFFIPAFAQVNGCIDSRGFCNKEKAKALLMQERAKMQGKALIIHSAEFCFNAEEAFALEGENKFNKIKIAEQLAAIRLHKIGPKPQHGYIDYFYQGKIHNTQNISGFKWIPNEKGKVQILEHPIWSDLYKEQMERDKKIAEENNEEFIMPEYSQMRDLYVAGVDGIDIGKNQTSKETRDPSDFCITILKRAFGIQEPQIVCMYKDRPNDIREAYKIAMCLCRYYNCRINIEATRVGFVTWARENKCLQYFMKRPRATLTDIKNGTSKQYGTPATNTIIEQHTQLTADFVEDYCHTIWFEEILTQLTSYNDENKTKFDIIAALGMTFLADQELSGRQPIKVEAEVEEFQDFGYYIDERGYKKFGVIPNKNPRNQIIIKQEDDPYRIETSDPRIYESLVPNGIYWRYSH